MKSQEMRQESLTRAVSSQSLMNYSAIYQELMSRGIPENDIKPRENVFTYQAWLALGRQVRKGEHGVRIVTFLRATRKDKTTQKEESYSRPWHTTVFHVSQTDAVKAVQS